MSEKGDFFTADQLIAKIDEAQKTDDGELHGNPIFRRVAEIHDRMKGLCLPSQDAVYHQFQDAIDEINQEADREGLFGEAVVLRGRVFEPEIVQDDFELDSLGHLMLDSGDSSIPAQAEGEFCGFSIWARGVEDLNDEDEIMGYSGSVCVRVGGGVVESPGFSADQYAFGIFDEVTFEFARDVRDKKIGEAEKEFLKTIDGEVLTKISEIEELCGSIFDEDGLYDVEVLQSTGAKARELVQHPECKKSRFEFALSMWLEAHIGLNGGYASFTTPTAIINRPPAPDGRSRFMVLGNENTTETTIEGEIVGISFLPQVESMDKLGEEPSVEEIKSPHFIVSAMSSDFDNEQIIHISLETLADIDVQVEGSA